MTGTIVDAKHLSKAIDGRSILSDVCMEVKAGNIVGIIGRNGAGKTSLLDVLLGFSPPSSGQSKIFGVDSLELPSVIKEKIGFVPQENELIGQIAVADQISLMGSLSNRWDSALVQRLLKTWNIPPQARIQDLTSGMRQKLSVLLALGHNPELLVLDEPASHLDPVSRRMFMQEIIGIAASGSRTVLFSTHVVSDLERVASQVLIMRDGRMVWGGDLDALQESIVRLRITSQSNSLPETLPLAHMVSFRSDGHRASAVVDHWDPMRLEVLKTELQASIEVEHLTLEDIFVELHA